MGTQVPIGNIRRFPQKVIVTNIKRVFGVSSLHLATHNHMHLGVECLRNMVFDWCFVLVINMKKKSMIVNLERRINPGTLTS